MSSIQEWIVTTLETPTFSSTVLLAAVLLGIIGSATNCCNVPIIGAIAGYSGSLGTKLDRKQLIITGLFFMLGTVIALSILGALTGFISGVVSTSMGNYWKFFAGFILIFFGLATLEILPGKPLKINVSNNLMPRGIPGAIVFGLAVGGAGTACSVGCNPVLPVALGVVALQGRTILGALILASFAVGYSLPIVAILIGLSAGIYKLTSVIQKIQPIIKILAGIVLIGIGFYLLMTVQ